MDGKRMMELYIINLDYKYLLTKLVALLCGNDNIGDYNYIFRMRKNDKRIILDIYENVTKIRFHRFIYCFSYGIHKDEFIDSVNVKTIYTKNIETLDDISIMFGIIFGSNIDHMLLYGKKYLPSLLYDVLVQVSEISD